MNILGIESSCDETAAAVVRSGTTIESSVVASQVAVHHPYGGVVPELASRKHLEAIVPVVAQALKAAGAAGNNLNGVAVTRGPGLIGSLLVGFMFAKSYAYARQLPWVGVNHLEAHINSVFLTPDPPRFPFVALLVSGGHTSLYEVTGHTAMDLMGQTRDDAAGEAFDKVAKLLGLGYPGGQAVDKLAALGDPAKIRFPRAMLKGARAEFDFSFSGLKTAVRRHVETHPGQGEVGRADIVAGFQEAVLDVLLHKLFQAAQSRQCDQVALVGGVAANSRLRNRLRREAAERGIEAFVPPLELCGDNAAMIAATGYHYLQAGQRASLDDDVFSRNRF
ncbi:MAG: tRNA (adenosine(37)-N6)-threonylcarbamoyltransferase complex transferase subunit TsaD [Desulfobacterales bacterium]